MTLLGQMLREEGIKEGLERGLEQGLEKGEFKNMLELVRDGVLTMEKAATRKEAAARKHMSVEEFQTRIRELKLG